MIKLRKIQFAIADDHAMLRKGLIRLLLMYGTFECVFEASNGEEIQKAIKNNIIPDIIILDIGMSRGNGFETAAWLHKHYPQVKILALSMYQDESTILKMIQAGANGYLTKNSEPEELKHAIETIYEKGVYIPEHLSAKLLSGIQNGVLNSPIDTPVLNIKEKQFLHLLCQELTYQQIAKKMFVSPRTIDDYRKRLTRKLNVKGRAGLIMYAIKHITQQEDTINQP